MFRLCLGIEGQCLLGIVQRLVHVISGGETAREIGKPYSDGLVRAGIFDNCNVVAHVGTLSVELPASLLIDITNKPLSQVFLRVRQHYRSIDARVLEDMV
jgi:hypothetical protein